MYGINPKTGYRIKIDGPTFKTLTKTQQQKVIDSTKKNATSKNQSYETMTVVQLKKICRERGIRLKECGTRKADIIEKLKKSSRAPSSSKKKVVPEKKYIQCGNNQIFYPSTGKCVSLYSKEADKMFNIKPSKKLTKVMFKEFKIPSDKQLEKIQSNLIKNAKGPVDLTTLLKIPFNNGSVEKATETANRYSDFFKFGPDGKPILTLTRSSYNFQNYEPWKTILEHFAYYTRNDKEIRQMIGAFMRDNRNKYTIQEARLEVIGINLVAFNKEFQQFLNSVNK